jgi:hypothetical protein
MAEDEPSIDFLGPLIQEDTARKDETLGPLVIESETPSFMFPGKVAKKLPGLQIDVLIDRLVADPLPRMVDSNSSSDLLRRPMKFHLLRDIFPNLRMF